jgi:LmbE family N-acetylglucosaminyl deacetylase
MGSPAAIAIGAHPDDIEFYMAGTLLLLRRAGYETHYLNLAAGDCGSRDGNASKTAARRRKEAKAAADVLGACFHRSFTQDLGILYEPVLIKKVAALLREVSPGIILTHSPQDYMEDHSNTSRLVVTAAFARGMTNFQTIPRRAAVDTEVAIYHGMPHGLRDPLRRRVVPGSYVNTAAVQDQKRQALACHQSQQSWLDVSQGLSSYLQTMEDMSRAVGRMSRKFKHAEGWRRHLHLGFSSKEIDPLRTALGKTFLVNASYERDLNT